jgi:hypothetical protein
MNRIKRLFCGLFGKSEKDKIRDKILSEEIDFGNIVSSSLLAKGLYDELKKICHPDKFKEEHDINKATEFFQLLVQNKGDYKKLLSLKEQIYKELPVNNKNC